MSEHKTSIQWKYDTEEFNIKTYNRDYEVRFDNGVVIPASAVVDFNGNSQWNNPEDLFVTSVMGCHMLTFFAVASIKKFTVDLYTDNAERILEKTVPEKW
jgi:organic hydroperoxide reductase OsmC/OhrA